MLLSLLYNKSLHTNCYEGNGATTKLDNFSQLYTYLKQNTQDLSYVLKNKNIIEVCTDVSQTDSLNNYDINVKVNTEQLSTISCENICNKISGCQGFTWWPKRSNEYGINTCKFFYRAIIK